MSVSLSSGLGLRLAEMVLIASLLRTVTMTVGVETRGCEQLAQSRQSDRDPDLDLDLDLELDLDLDMDPIRTRIQTPGSGPRPRLRSADRREHSGPSPDRIGVQVGSRDGLGPELTSCFLDAVTKSLSASRQTGVDNLPAAGHRLFLSSLLCVVVAG